MFGVKALSGIVCFFREPTAALRSMSYVKLKFKGSLMAKGQLVPEPNRSLGTADSQGTVVHNCDF